ncbi:hypothetical protein [Actinocatenispora sera]|uniref:PH domain-containing protein n=1 Tax=Actinocatenispora sera TaxID=390989 RepID=A0A810L4M0_9ACTN|nr:hypothetical protein [Actinocatenispora sera]BCJ29068.1 hypothetical protein Asera_31760 [Actinocatenispora sera]
MVTAAELGAAVATHRTNNGRRGTIAVILLPVGAVVTGAAVLLWIVTAEVAARSIPSGADPELVPAAVLGLGIGMLLLGVLFAVAYHTHRDESFTVYENGLANVRPGRTFAARWADIDRVTVRPGKDNALSRWAGGDYYCLVTLADGRKVAINGLTENARQLIQLIQAHAPASGGPTGPGATPRP